MTLAALAGGCLGSCALVSELGEAIARAFESMWYLKFHLSSPWSSDGSRLLVNGELEGGLFVLGLDGGEPLVVAKGTISTASFSPHGGAIALESWEGPANDRGGRDLKWNALWVMRSDGSEPVQVALSHEPTDFFPAWSPDGEWIAYEIQGRIELVRPDLSERRQLGLGSIPAWSPDGRLVATTLVRDDEPACLQLLSIQGSPPLRLTQGSFPSWSPDGTRLAFTQHTGNEKADPDVFVIDADGSNRRRLCGGLFPRWSPVGERLLVLRRDSSKPFRLVTIAPDGSDERHLASEVMWGHWSPDGRLIAFGRGGEVFVVDADGSNERSLGRPALRAPVPESR